MFSYLRASLSGSAASAITGFPLTGSNYSGAVKLLKGRYGDSQKIISTHMDLLINLPAVLNGKDLKAMRQLSPYEGTGVPGVQTRTIRRTISTFVVKQNSKGN
jgi:hypothetical protein